jgi:Flp pilus assembly protein TadD
MLGEARMTRTIRTILLVAAFALSAGAHADGSESFKPSAKDDADWKAGKAAIDTQNWKVAAESFNRAARKFSDNPDIYNWLGYSQRKAGDLESAFKNYNTALRLDPSHRGAHEYIGEAYLMKGDLAQAEKHLQALDRLCQKSCEEYQDLAKSIAEFKTKK